MHTPELERRFLSLLREYLVSLPSDLKVLQEAVADPDLDRETREIAAGTIVHSLLPQEGDGLLRYVDDVIIVRAALLRVSKAGEEASGLRGRFTELFEALDEATGVMSRQLGETWTWLASKVTAFPKLPYKGRRASQYVDDEEAQALLYDEGLEFETNYNVTEEQVKNRLRRIEQVTELLAKKRTDEAKKIGGLY